LKVGLATVDFDEWADPAARPDFAKAVDVIRGLGVQMTAAKLPDFPYGALTSTIITAEGASIFEPLIASGNVDQLIDHKHAAGLRAGLEIPAKDYLKAMRIRSLVQQALRDILAGVDVPLTPRRLGAAPQTTPALDR